MRKRVLLVVEFLALAIYLTSGPVSAQILRPAATLAYVVPQDFDPPRVVTFLEDGELRTTDDQGDLLTGDVLLTDGLELHGRISGEENFQNIVEIHMAFSPFPGHVTIQRTAHFGFARWKVANYSLGAQKFFRFIKKPRAAPLNDDFDPNPDGEPDRSFARLSATVRNDADNTFAQALFSFRAFVSPASAEAALETLGAHQAAVPEPGALALLVGLLAGSLPLFRRIRRR